MSQTHQGIADTIVTEFIQRLDTQVQGSIPPSLQAELSFKIREALDAQSEEAARLVEQLAKTLRLRIDRPQLEL